MEIGDYVRTSRGIIAKIIKVNSTGSITCDRSIYYGFNIVNNKRILKDFSSIVKSSPSIIELIQVGDYVNGKLVIKVATDYIFDYSEEIKIIYFSENDYIYRNQDIKSIVTKEQFESMEYRIGD